MKMSFGSVLMLTLLLIGYIYWSLAQPLLMVRNNSLSSTLLYNYLNLSTSIIQFHCKIQSSSKAPGETCRLGIFTNVCNEEDCLRGPGDRCGETPIDKVRYGQCLPNLVCCNERCIGCTLHDCFDVACHQNRGKQHRSDPFMPDRHRNPLYALLDYYGSE